MLTGNLMRINKMSLQEILDSYDTDMMTFDGFDEAIIGVSERDGSPPVIAYDIEKCIQVLVDRDGMSREDATEYIDFDVMGAWIGEGTPVFVVGLYCK